MNGASIVVLLIVAICFALALKKVINDKTNGCGCSGCSGCDKCTNSVCSSHKKIEIDNKNMIRKEK
ncbi:MAG: FeoB-associated Cys-rich membrane protein [Clostridium sp.]|nr:FeoB-associated Cys-rich membrane protein [Clostridium sp.]